MSYNFVALAGWYNLSQIIWQYLLGHFDIFDETLKNLEFFLKSEVKSKLKEEQFCQVFLCENIQFEMVKYSF